MRRSARGDPNIYQVDLVAALFGGFMIIWLTSAADQEYPSSETQTPYYVTVEAKIIDDTGMPLIGLVDKIWVNTQCLQSSFLEKIEVYVDSIYICSSQYILNYSINSNFEKNIDSWSFKENVLKYLTASYGKCTPQISGRNLKFSQIRTFNIESLAGFNSIGRIQKTESTAVKRVNYVGNNGNSKCEMLIEKKIPINIYLINDFSKYVTNDRIKFKYTWNDSSDVVIHYPENPTKWLLGSNPTPFLSAPDFRLSMRVCAWKDGSPTCFIGVNSSAASGNIDLLRDAS